MDGVGRVHGHDARVPTIAYAPWAAFCYDGPVFSLLIVALYRRTGFGILRLEEGEVTSPLAAT